MYHVTIGFSKSKKFFPVGSWVIRLYQRTPYSHVYIKFYSESLERSIIYEAVGQGVRFIGNKAWGKFAEPVSEFKISVSKDQYVELMRFCVDTSGLPYSYTQNLGIFLANLFKLKTNPLNSKGYNCSEVIANILSKQGYEFKKDLNLITPKEIYEALNGKS